jgi:hypothetical protein
MIQTVVNALGFRIVIEIVDNCKIHWLIKVRIYFYIIYIISLEVMQIK